LKPPDQIATFSPGCYGVALACAALFVYPQSILWLRLAGA
jgi:hypothetical protein